MQVEFRRMTKTERVGERSIHQSTTTGILILSLNTSTRKKARTTSTGTGAENEENGYPFVILNWALHQDEEGAPHIQQRMVWIYDDPKTGLRTTGQNKALKKAGVEVTDSSMEEGRYNNRKKEFERELEEKYGVRLQKGAN